MFKESIDDAFGPVIVLGIEMSQSEVLLKVDPIAYHTAFDDWLDMATGSGAIIEQGFEYYLAP